MGEEEEEEEEKEATAIGRDACFGSPGGVGQRYV